jgi:hypothetical protein
MVLCTVTYAQQTARVLVQNAVTATSEKSIVIIKWYSQSLVYPAGVNVYRQQTGQTEWIKLNKTPIAPQKIVPPAWLQQEDDLDGFLDMANNLGRSTQDGFILLNLFVKSFQSSAYSRLIGIEWQDNTAQWGQSYTYKVMKITDGGETDLAASPSIIAGPYTPQTSVEAFTVRQQGSVANMQWKEDQQRFYGVNVYSSTSADPDWKKLNATPIVQSETEGAPASEVMYRQEGLREGTVYQYRITGLDFFGGETETSAVQEIRVGDLTPPPAPLNVTKRINKLSVSLRWDVQQTADLNGFFIYRSTVNEGPFQRVNLQPLQATDTSFVDTVQYPAFYYYYVAATDQAGNEKASEFVLAEVPDIFPPAVPVNMQAKADTGKVILTWSPNKELDLKGYYIYRSIRESTQDSFALINADPVMDTTYVQVLPRNTANLFRFKVAAVDTLYNRSAPSTEVAVQLPDGTPPGKPYIKDILVRGDSVFVAWLSNTEKDMAGFELYRSASSEKVGRKRHDVLIDKNVVAYSDTIRSAGKFYYRLRALDSAGNASEYSDPYPVTSQILSSLSFNKVLGDYKKRRKAVILQWETSSKPAGFVVFRKAVADSAWRPLSGFIDDNEFEDKSAERRRKYEYQIRAYLSEGQTVVSKPVLVSAGK